MIGSLLEACLGGAKDHPCLVRDPFFFSLLAINLHHSSLFKGK